VTEPLRLPSSPVAVPTLSDLLGDPSLFDGLPRTLQDVLFEQAVVLEARLRAKVMARHRTDERAPTAPDRAVGIDEACSLFGMERGYLERRGNWTRLGGYKDDDGHVKFRMSDVQRHLQRKAKDGRP
jgi:hypothetical protein